MKFYLENCCPFSSICLLIYELWTHGYLFYGLKYHHYFIAQIVPAWPWGPLSDWLLHTCGMPHPFMSTSLLSCISRCSRLFLYFPCLGHGINPLSREAWFLLFRNKNLGTECVYCHWVSLLLGPHREQSLK